MTASNKYDRLPDAPIEYAGQWIAWNDDWTEIVAHGIDLAEVSNAARLLGVKQPLLEKVPRPDTHYIGAL